MWPGCLMIRTCFLTSLLGAAATHPSQRRVTAALEVHSSGSLLRRQLGDSHNGSQVEELLDQLDALKADTAAPAAEATGVSGADDDSFRWQGLDPETNRSANRGANLTKIAPSDDCVELETLYLSNGDLGPKFTAPDQQSCKERCKSVASCAHWSYAKEAQLCFLQTATARPVSDKGITSGFPGPCNGGATPVVTPAVTPVVPVTGTPTPSYASYGPRKKGEHCLKLSASYTPLEMADTSRSKEMSYELCQFRCLKTRYCAHFTYFLEDQGCHLQGNSSRMIYVRGSIAGDASCSQAEKEKFEAYMRSLPRMNKSDAVPCEDSWSSFIADSSATSCQTLAERGSHEAECKHSAMVRDNCPVLCGICGPVA